MWCVIGVQGILGESVMNLRSSHSVCCCRQGWRYLTASLNLYFSPCGLAGVSAEEAAQYYSVQTCSLISKNKCTPHPPELLEGLS